jgi:hypothetical protein
MRTFAPERDDKGEEITYYLAGPMTGYGNFNYDLFEEATAHLRGCGYSIVSPHEIFGDETSINRGHRPASYYMRRALAELLGCDAIIFLPGWQQSLGVRTELNVALAVDMKLYSFNPAALSRPIELP